MNDYASDFPPVSYVAERVRRFASLPAMPPDTWARILDEQAIVGALARGTLRPRDVADLLADAWVPSAIGAFHARLLCAVEATVEAFRRPRIDAAIRVCHAMGEPLAGAVVRGRCVGYLVGLARAAPSRREAVAAVRRVEVGAEDRRVEDGRRETRARSAEARALRAALEAVERGEDAAALSALARAERAICGVRVTAAA